MIGVVKRKAIEITGIVQGIGYRPFVYNLGPDPFHPGMGP